jgi:hypothetical protein
VLDKGVAYAALLCYGGVLLERLRGGLWVVGKTERFMVLV